jgi:SPOR domain
MADSNFRPYRSRDPQPPRSDPPARGQVDDPLAELARLIGQGDPADGYGRDARRGPTSFDEPGGGGLDWAADDRYAEPNEAAEDVGYEEQYEPTPALEPYVPPRRPAPPAPFDRAYETRAPAPYSEPAPRLDPPRDNTRGYAAPAPAPLRYRDERNQSEQPGRPLPAFLPRARSDRYDYDDQSQDGPNDQDYAPDDYEDEAPSGRKRGGFVVIAAVLGLAVLGTAGAFAYRAMFGGSMLPSLPPIIRADDGPNKIVPNATSASAPDQQAANTTTSGEKLVSREEQPVDVPSAVNPAPRVVSTIPIFPDPNSGQGATAQSAPQVVPVAPMSSTPPPVASATSAGAVPLSTMATPQPKKVHTVPITPDQMAGPDVASAAAMPLQSAPVAVPAARPPRPVAAYRPPDPNAPLSIVPDQGGAPPAPVRTRTALAQPTAIAPSGGSETAAAAPTGTGGYAVQVTSQRSAAEAQSAFRSLAAKYPQQLGGHAPIVRRADLGEKGVYYRALVGPFASMEQAASLCSNLKAAGGNCIVQKD